MAKKIKLNYKNKIYYTLVDDSDYEYLNQWKWYFYTNAKSKTNYVIRPLYIKQFKKTLTLKMHRIITNCPKGLQIDHINHNGLDNRKCNLRICTPRENRYNMKNSSNKSTGLKGIYKYSKNKYRYIIKRKQKYMSKCGFDNIKDCMIAYNEVVKKYYGEFGYLHKV